MHIISLQVYYLYHSNVKALACRTKMNKKRQYWEGIPCSNQKCVFKTGQVRGNRNFLTVYFIQWNLAKYLKVGTIKHPSEYPFHSAVIGMK